MNDDVLNSALKMLGANETINRDVLQWVYALGKVDALLEYKKAVAPERKAA